jgi:hypothetical protein
MGASGKRTASGFSAHAMAHEYLDIYESVLRG